jgi:hypothetical protein
MQPHIVGAHVKELGHLPLRQPDGFVFRPELDLAPAVFRGLEDEVVHVVGASEAEVHVKTVMIAPTGMRVKLS